MTRRGVMIVCTLLLAPVCRGETVAEPLEVTFDNSCPVGDEAFTNAPDSVRKKLPRFTNLPKPPPLPEAARRNNERGTVVLRMLVNEEGRVARTRVSKSSGFERLDRTAVEHSRKWRFLPATLDGKPTCAWGVFGVTFKE